jgi:thioredoxin-related protein
MDQASWKYFIVLLLLLYIYIVVQKSQINRKVSIDVWFDTNLAWALNKYILTCITYRKIILACIQIMYRNILK